MTSAWAWLPPALLVTVANVLPRLRFSVRLLATLAGLVAIAVQATYGIVGPEEMFFQFVIAYVAISGKYANDGARHNDEGPAADRMPDWGTGRYILDPTFSWRYQLKIWRSPRSRAWLLNQAMPLPRCISRDPSEWQGWMSVRDDDDFRPVSR